MGVGGLAGRGRPQAGAPSARLLQDRAFASHICGVSEMVSGLFLSENMFILYFL